MGNIPIICYMYVGADSVAYSYIVYNNIMYNILFSASWYTRLLVISSGVR